MPWGFSEFFQKAMLKRFFERTREELSIGGGFRRKSRIHLVWLLNPDHMVGVLLFLLKICIILSNDQTFFPVLQNGRLFCETKSGKNFCLTRFKCIWQLLGEFEAGIPQKRFPLRKPAPYQGGLLIFVYIMNSDKIVLCLKKY